MAFSKAVHKSSTRAVQRRNHTAFLVLFCLTLAASCFAQIPFVTGRSDLGRTAANTNETLLTPGNVNANSFGKLFNYNVDYQVLAQPLYVPNVQIPGLGTHNVVYVATMADSVYAFDADSPQGTNGQPLWSVNFTDPANGITLASYIDGTLPCTSAKSGGPGFNQEGIVSTPVIDPASGTLYVVAKTVENGTVHHRLHALDITNGQEKFGGPIVISATTVSNAGHKVTFNSLHQKNRPGLLLLNGAIYMAFGSNYCNDHNHSWVLSYDAASLQQLGVFDANPDHGYSSIWQSGQPIAADADGNIYVTTSEGKFDVPQGGQGYASSVLKLSSSQLALTDYFTPWNVDYLDTHDLDLSSSGPIVLPDQPDPIPHIVVAGGKQGTIYVLNRDNMGQFNPEGDSQIVQELPFAVGPLFDSPAYWNGMLYFAGNADPIKGFSVANSQLSALPIIMTTQKYVGSHSPSISANGDTNGILWVMSGQRLYAFDALSLQPLYNSGQNALPRTAHFATQTVVNGKVYIATQTTLEVYGLIPAIGVVSGGGQSGTVGTVLASPVQVQAADPYTGAPVAGASVTFSDGGNGGTFNPTTAITDSSGYASSSYRLPTKSGSYTITASASGLASASSQETALPGPPARMAAKYGNQQSGYVGTVLAAAVSARVLDSYNNAVPGVTVTFSDQGKGGVLTPNPCVTDGNGLANVQYQLPTKPGTYAITASAQGLKSVKFTETAVAGPAANMAVTGGDNQSAPAGTQLPQALSVAVTDPYGDPVPGVSVSLSDGGAGGSFSANPVTTDGSGIATVMYTLPQKMGAVAVTATAGQAAATFTETATAGGAAQIAVTGGNNQAAPAGTQLPQALTAQVTDQYGNPVSGVGVTFDDGGAGGFFYYSNPVNTDNTGTATQIYTLPPSPGTYNISAVVAGAGTPAIFTETGQ